MRNDNVGRECWILRLDMSDDTAQVEHYDGSSSWYPQAALYRVPDPEMESQDPPRFEPGTRVECNMGEAGVFSGTIRDVWYRMRGWKRRDTAVYSIDVDSPAEDGNQMITAPYDKDATIRRLVE